MKESTPVGENDRIECEKMPVNTCLGIDVTLVNSKKSSHVAVCDIT